MITGRRVAAAVGIALLAASVGVLANGPSAAAATAPAAGHWVATWTASPTDSLTPTDATGLPVPGVLTDQTLRMIVVPHLGGAIARVHLSNRFGSSAVTFGRVALGREGSGSLQGVASVTFGGKSGVTLAAGKDVTSDPVRVPFPAFTPLAVSIYLPGVQRSPTKHWNANATSFYSAPFSGDLTGTSTDSAFPLRTEAWLYVDGIDVEAPPATRAIVAFGDSITDGFVAATPASLPATIEVADKNGRYPDDLQRRLIAVGAPLSVVNAGIGSNRLLTDGEPTFQGLSGLERFQSDALDHAGVTGVLLLEGINDLGIPPATTTADELIAGYEQVISKTHAAGKKIWLGTILPASNALFDGTALAPKSETYREQVNSWIRTQHLADGVVDFDAAMRDPSNPTVLNPPYSGPDHLHPNLRGYQAMANAVNLAMLQS